MRVVLMKKILMIFAALAFVLLLAGCLGQQTSPAGGNGAASGSANYQRCISQCAPGNAGNGTLCRDGCSVQEAADTKSTTLCDSLIDQANRPSCYGTVAKSSGDISVCDRLSNPTDKNHCLSVFGSPSTG
jgi:hypothetical protein